MYYNKLIREKELKKMTKKEMILAIAKEFMIYQSKSKAQWIYNQLSKMNKAEVKAHYEGFIINRTQKITPWR
jgi:hypothetical protein